MRLRTADDQGFSVVELIIAMFLLSVIALALLPLLIGVTKSSTANRSIVEATSFANAQIASLGARFPAGGDNACASVVAAASAAATATAPAGTDLSVAVSTSACPAVKPGTLTVTVTAFRTGSPTAPLATVITKIVVTS